MGKKRKSKPVGISTEMEVLTKTRGWAMCDQINNLEIACLKDGKLVYEKPNKVSVFEDFEGPIYNFKNDIFEFKVSGNFSLYFQNNNSEVNTEQAEKLLLIHKDGVKFQNDVLYDAQDYQFIIPEYEIQLNPKMSKIEKEKIVLMKPWLIFFGIYFTNGLIDITYSNEIMNNDKIVIRINNETVEKELSNALDELGYKWSFSEDEGYNVYKNNNWKIIICHDKHLAKYLKTLDIKILPDWILNLSSIQSSILLSAMLYHTDKLQKFIASTQNLADQMQQLCLHAGFSDIILKNQDYFIVDIYQKQNIENLSCQKEYLQNEKCAVFNVVVPSKIFYVRKNGKPMWI